LIKKKKKRADQRSFDLSHLAFLLVMANKKKKAGSHRSRLKQQKLADAQFVNDSAVLALPAPPNTIPATVPPISNSKQSPLVDFASEGLRPPHHVLSSPHGPASHLIHLCCWGPRSAYELLLLVAVFLCC